MSASPARSSRTAVTIRPRTGSSRSAAQSGSRSRTVAGESSTAITSRSLRSISVTGTGSRVRTASASPSSASGSGARLGSAARSTPRVHGLQRPDRGRTGSGRPRRAPGRAAPGPPPACRDRTVPAAPWAVNQRSPNRPARPPARPPRSRAGSARSRSRPEPSSGSPSSTRTARIPANGTDVNASTWYSRAVVIPHHPRLPRGPHGRPPPPRRSGPARFSATNTTPVRATRADRLTAWVSTGIRCCPGPWTSGCAARTSARCGPGSPTGWPAR